MIIASLIAAIVVSLVSMSLLAVRLRNNYRRDSRKLVQSLIADLPRTDTSAIDNFERPEDFLLAELPVESDDAKFDEALESFVHRINESRQANREFNSRVPPSKEAIPAI